MVERIVTVCFLLFIFATSVEAEPIDGGFGVILSKPMNDELLAEFHDFGGEKAYVFLPKSPFRTLSKYYAIITPVTRQVYHIAARGEFGSEYDCVQERELIMALLEKKYGSKNENNSIDRLKGREVIRQGTRVVMVQCSGYGPYTLAVDYIDKLMFEKAKKERIDVESKAVDATGL